MRPIKHHYIPEFYLKRWANKPDPRLCEFSRPYDVVKPKRVAPGGTGYVNRLYALRGFPEELAQQVEEQFFKVVDNGAAEALESLEREGSASKLSINQRSAWSRFLLSLLSRTPEDVTAFREVWERHLSNVSVEAQRGYEAGRGRDDPATLAELLAARPLAEREQDLFEAFMRLMDNPSLGGRLNGHPFRVLDFPGDIELLTSDRPIVRNHSGLGAPGGHLAIAIGPRRLFVTSPEVSFLDAVEQQGRRSLAVEMNRSVVRQAKLYAYGRTDDGLEFVRKHFATVEEPRLISLSMLDRMRQRENKHKLESRPDGWHALLASNTKPLL